MAIHRHSALLSGRANRAGMAMIEAIRPPDIGLVAKGRHRNVIAIRHAQRPLLMIMALCIVAGIQIASVDSDDDADYQLDRHLQRGLFADTKYWLRNMEFGDQDNWSNNLKPCTMLERIAFDEDGGAVVSLGDNLVGSLESASIRQLVLPNDGVLLLQSDTLDSETAYMKYLAAHSVDCFDSDSLPDQLQGQHWFKFGPDSDHLSWFNPANWRSDLTGAIADLMPDSHRIPCSHDIVVLGIDSSNLILDESSQSSPLVSPFKVNFRPSELMLTTQSANLKPIDSSLRVAKLKIGSKSYMPEEFNQLIEIYGDNLMLFNDQKSIFNLGRGNFTPDEDWRRVLTIDESSLSAELLDRERCLDVAGCVCANEQAEMMNIICSFNQPLDADHMLCEDPIRSAGYCDPICATTITINMNPLDFSESFVLSIINKLMDRGPVENLDIEPSQVDAKYFGESVFFGGRRTDQGKYVITLRIYPLHNDEYEIILGRERELAQLIMQHLDRPALRSFYGIKSVSIRSSVRWRRNSQESIFLIVFIMIAAILILELVLYEGRIVENVMHRTNTTWIYDWLNSIQHSHLPSGMASDIIACETITGSGGSIDCVDGDLDQGLDGAERDPTMIELDTRSVTDSTLNLLIE